MGRGASKSSQEVIQRTAVRYIPLSQDCPELLDTQFLTITDLDARREALGRIESAFLTGQCHAFAAAALEHPAFSGWEPVAVRYNAGSGRARHVAICNDSFVFDVDGLTYIDDWYKRYEPDDDDIFAEAGDQDFAFGEDILDSLLASPSMHRPAIDTAKIIVPLIIQCHQDEFDKNLT